MRANKDNAAYLLASVVRRLNEPGASCMTISRTSGVAYNTILRIKSGSLTNPQINTLDAIHHALEHAHDKPA